MIRARALPAMLGLVGLAACSPEDSGGPLPDFEWQGDWITVLGYERAPEETCAGSFAYADAYTGALAEEFGVAAAPVGVYRWYGRDLFAELDPCHNDDPGKSCTGLNGVFSSAMPVEHEIVHLVNDRAVLCPFFLAEGLAEYYGTTGSTPSSLDLSEILAEPGAIPFASKHYPVAGAFIAFLVETHGLDPILEICERSGMQPTAAEFDDAVVATLGVSAEVLAQEFTASFDCTYSQYRSKLYECGLEPALVLGDQPAELHLTLDCADEGTIGPRASRIWTLAKIRIPAEDTYVFSLEDESGAGITDEAGLQLMPCTSCGEAAYVRTYDPGPEPIWDVAVFHPADYIVKVWGDPDLSKRLVLRFNP